MRIKRIPVQNGTASTGWYNVYRVVQLFQYCRTSIRDGRTSTGPCKECRTIKSQYVAMSIGRYKEQKKVQRVQENRFSAERLNEPCSKWDY